MPRGPIPIKLKPENVTALIDSREQWPLDLSPLRTIQLKEDDSEKGLVTGDYSVLHLRKFICVERKTLEDFLACVGRERERFERCIERMLAIPHRLLVIETTPEQLKAGEWQSRITPRQAIGSLKSWRNRGIAYVLAGSHEAAGKVVAEFLVDAANYYYSPAARLAAAGFALPMAEAEAESEEVEELPF